MSIANTLKSLARKLDGAKAATSETTTTISQLRGEITARRKELGRVQHLPVPREEMRARAQTLVAQTGARFLKEEAAAVVYGDYALGRPDVHGDTRLPWQRQEGLVWAALCAGAPDVALTLLEGLITRVEYDEGLPTAERAARVAQLERELVELETAEEAFIDEAAALGVQIEHRPEVRARRDTERRQQELEEQAAAARQARQEALDQAHARRPRVSQYIAQTRADLHATQELVDRLQR